jgi:hypothetical protein
VASQVSRRELQSNQTFSNTLRRETAPSRTTRSRSNTAHGYAERFNPVEEEPEPSPPRMTIPKLASRSRSPAPDMAGSPGGYALRPALSRTSTHDSYANGRDDSPARRLSRVPTDSSVISSRNNLRPVRQQNAFADDYEDEDYTGSGSNYRRDRSPPSPDHSSQGSGRVMSRAASWSQNDGGATTPGGKRAPPPPPSRAKKPPPPPPPMKRSALSETTVTRY